jgi:hypothetical protein
MLQTGIGILFFLLLLTIHECGHIVSAWILRLRISRIGFAKFPVFHPYVEVEHVPDNIVKHIFLYSGPFTTLVLFIVSMLMGWLHYPPLFYAFVALMIVEYNPYHSDFTIAYNAGREDKRTERSMIWYLLFMLWIAFGAFCLAPEGLKSIVDKF